jgi:hypothetical protein
LRRATSSWLLKWDAGVTFDEPVMVQNGIYRLRPSNGTSFNSGTSTSSKQRTLMATISPPFGAVPRENAES